MFIIGAIIVSCVIGSIYGTVYGWLCIGIGLIVLSILECFE